MQLLKRDLVAKQKQTDNKMKKAFKLKLLKIVVKLEAQSAQRKKRQLYEEKKYFLSQKTSEK